LVKEGSHWPLETVIYLPGEQDGSQMKRLALLRLSSKECKTHIAFISVWDGKNPVYLKEILHF
jgi:hypothetical protein